MNRSEKRRQQKLAKKAEKKTFPFRKTLERATELHNAGRLDEAENLYRKTLQADPNQILALNFLGVIAHQTGNNEGAIELISKAISINPQYAEAYCNLGAVYMAQGDLDLAIESLSKAISLKPHEALTHNNLGVAYRTKGNFDKAVSSFQKAIQIHPNYADAQSNLGNAYIQLREMTKARECYKNSLAINPNSGSVYRHLAHIHKFTEYDDDIRDMEQTYARLTHHSEQRMHVCFALGKAFEDLHEYDKAFDFYAEGNAIKRKSYNYSIEASINAFNKLKKTFKPSLFAKHDGDGCKSQTPIFIVGMPRSGTTLVEQILASHPNVYGAGEIIDFARVYAAHFGSSGILESNAEHISEAGHDYIDRLNGYAASEPFITNKLPNNFELIGAIKLMLPKAKVIHCCRSPQDNCLSIFKTYFSDGVLHYAYDLAELGQYYTLYQDLMEYWHGVLPDFIYDIQYEDLVANQEQQSKALVEHCGLKWDDTCIEFHKTKRAVNTASSEQVRKPIYKSSIQAWKHYEKQLAPLLLSFNK